MTEQKYVVALDQGTTSSRAVVLDHDANIVSVSQREFTQIYPQAGGWSTIQWKSTLRKAQHWLKR